MPLDERGRGASVGGRKVEGNYVDYGKLPLGCPQPADGNARRGPVGFFPGGPGSIYQGTDQPGASSPFQVGHFSAAGDGPIACGRRQGKEKEQSSPLTQPRTLVIDSPRWSRVIGLTSHDIHISNGEVYAASSPGPIRASDLMHVALAVETGGRDFVLSQAPWSKPMGKACVYQVPKRYSHSHTFNSSHPTASLAGVSLGIRPSEMGSPAQAGQTFTHTSDTRYILSGYS